MTLRSFVAAARAGMPLAAVLALGVELTPRANAAPPAATSTKRMRWVNTLDEAVAAAKKEKKLVLVDFYTDWCGWCKRLDKDVFAVDSFQVAAADVIGVKVNAEKHPAIAKKFAVSSYPRLFFLGSDGHTLEQVKGYLSLADFTAKVKAVLAGDTEYRRYRDAASDPSDFPAVQRFARFLSESSRFDEAVSYWQQLHDHSVRQLFAAPNSPQAAALHRDALFELGRAHADMGFVDVAHERFDEVAVTYPGSSQSAQALLQAAQLDMKAKKTSCARGHLQRLLREAPQSPAASQAAALLQSLPVSGPR